DAVVLGERYGADLDLDTAPVGADDDDLGVGHLLGAGHLPREVLAGAEPFLRRDDRGHQAPAHVTDDPLGGRVDPTDHAVGVDHVAGNPDRLECLPDVARDLAAGAHFTPPDGAGSGGVGGRRLAAAGSPAGAAAAAAGLLGGSVAPVSFTAVVGPGGRAHESEEGGTWGRTARTTPPHTAAR